MSTPPASLPRTLETPTKAHVTRIELGRDISVEVRPSPNGKTVLIAINVPPELPVTVTEQ